MKGNGMNKDNNNLNNRLHNSGNPNQGSARRVLCVCSAGLLRSPTAANVIHKLYGYNTRAVGIVSDFALIPIDQVVIHWADEIVCMSVDQKMALELITDTPVQCLDISDSFCWMDAVLIKIIERTYDKDFINSLTKKE